ncbi:MAG: 4-carboxymuconolactone decarboxylase [Crocinitomicaceae bacterium]|nr:4-carboxymuconolactone decarboxylase [Crocinitomicaceae bacterium]
MNYNISTYTEPIKASKEHFTGTVWVSMITTPDELYNMSSGNVIFEPQARTNWHSHDNGQVLMVTDGVGYYQEEGKPILEIKKGDVVKIPAKTKHWHGGSHYSSMSHIAIVTETDQYASAIWMEVVSDEDYNSILSDKKAAIALSENAVKNHELLWPDYHSTFALTDPDLIEVFDNWAFDEVFEFGDVDPKLKVMTIMASTIATQSTNEYRMFVNAALNIGVSPIEIKEIVYQTVPYLGIAKVVESLKTCNEVLTEQGISLPLESQSTTNRETRFDEGLAIQKATFGNRIEQMQKNAPQGQEHIQGYLSANCFGDYYTRTGLDMKTRELLTYAMLISLGGTDSQVRGHIQGNLNIGNDKEKLIAITTQLLPYIGYPRTLNALNAINEITEKQNENNKTK